MNPAATNLHQVTIQHTCDGCGGNLVTNQQHAPWIQLLGKRYHVGCAIPATTELGLTADLRDLLAGNHPARLTPGWP